MEIATYINDINKLDQSINPYKPHNLVIYEKHGNLYETIGQHVKFKPSDRLYFGSEFCQKLVPSIDDCKKAYTYSVEHNMKFSYVTSCLFDDGMRKVDKNLDYMNQLENEIEVICNDWGTVHHIKNKYKNLKIVIGRMLDKLSREPRLSQEQFMSIYNHESFNYLKTPNICVPEYMQILHDYDIAMVELDCVPQGLNLSNLSHNRIKVALHMPYYYVTTGVICMTQILRSQENDKYNFSKECSHSCKNIDIFMNKSNFNGIGNNLELIRKGNTIYKDISNISQYLSYNECVNRIILQYF